MPTMHGQNHPDSKVHGANMGPTWGQQDPGWPHEPCYLGVPIADDCMIFTDTLNFIGDLFT